MNKHSLREVAKFASGLIAGDFLCGLWFYWSGMLPITFFGITFTVPMVMGWMVFDIILFALLVHFAWYTHQRPRTSAERQFHLAIAVLLGVVAILHLLRLLFGINLVIGTWQLPYWINGLGTLIAAFLAYTSYHLARHER